RALGCWSGSRRPMGGWSDLVGRPAFGRAPHCLGSTWNRFQLESQRTRFPLCTPTDPPEEADTLEDATPIPKLRRARKTPSGTSEDLALVFASTRGPRAESPCGDR